MSLASDKRGLAVGIAVFFGMLVLGALLYIVMDAALADVFDITSSSASSPGASDQITLAEAIWDNILYVVLFISMLFLIGRAVSEGARS